LQLLLQWMKQEYQDNYLLSRLRDIAAKLASCLMTTTKIILFLLLIPSTALSQTNLPFRITQQLVCTKHEVMLRALKEIGERLEWVAKSDSEDQLSVSLWSSSTNNTYTILISSTEYSCILHTGSDRTFLNIPKRPTM